MRLFIVSDLEKHDKAEILCLFCCLLNIDVRIYTYHNEKKNNAILDCFYFLANKRLQILIFLQPFSSLFLFRCTRIFILITVIWFIIGDEF